MEYERNTEDKESGPLSTERVRWAKCRWAEVAAVGAILIGSAAGCEQEVSPTMEIAAHRAAAATPAPTLNLQDGPGAALGKYQMHWPKRSQDEVADRIAKVATVLRQKPVRLVLPSAVGRDLAKPLDDDKLQVAYDGNYDTIWVRDEALVMAEESPSDIGEKQAQSAMKAAFKDLVAAGLIEARHYDLGDIQAGHHHLRAGSDDGSPTREIIVEYRFRVLRKLNGIDVPNNGILIGIAPSGQRSTVKMGGVKIDSVYNGAEERPTQANSVVSRKVASADIKKRFEKEVLPANDKHIVWSKLMYVMPEGLQEALVEPTMVYRFAPLAVGAGGEAHVMFARLYSFSLSDEGKPPVDLFPR